MSQSILHRFLYTVGSNLLRAGVSFITSLLIARLLGPGDFGRMAFLSGTFLALRALMEMGTSSAFFTFISQTERSARFFRVYVVWMVAQLLIPALVIGVLFPDQWVDAIWKGEQRVLVILALVAVFMQNGAWITASQAAEAQRKTLLAQNAGLFIALMHFVAMLVLGLLGSVGVVAVFAALIIEHAIAVWWVTRHLGAPKEADVSQESIADIARKFKTFCAPLVPYIIISFLADFADRWVLQHYGGSVEQAFYGVGAQFSTVSLIATTSILRIFWKEIAEANHRGDHPRMAVLYRKVVRILYFVGAAVSGGLIPWSAQILQLTLGPAYLAGAGTLAVMLLYPIHQSLGQIVGTLLYATERVRLQVVCGSITMTIGIVATYFVLAPSDAGLPGLALGSEGLAWKMVCIQLVNVNLIMWLIARALGWRFEWGFQILVLLLCLSLGYLARSLSLLVLPPMPAVWMPMAASLSFYLLMCGTLFWLWPSLGGLSRSDFQAYVDRVRGWLSRH